jgi:hypothetical protein
MGAFKKVSPPRAFLKVAWGLQGEQAPEVTTSQDLLSSVHIPHPQAEHRFLLHANLS